MNDSSLVGTAKAELLVEGYIWPRMPGDGPPDTVSHVEIFLEADLQTQITDPERIAAIKAKQEKQNGT